jgi:hypothetical protein
MPPMPRRAITRRARTTRRDATTWRALTLLAGAALLLLLAGPVRAQVAEAVRYDSSAVTLRAPEADAYAPYLADDAYDYDRERAAGEPSLWERLWRWVGRGVSGLLSDRRARPLVRLVVYGLIAGILFFAVTRLLRMSPSGFFSRRPARAAPDFDLGAEDALQELDLEALLRAALDAGDRRRAVRLLYLRTLRRLDAAGHVAWTPDKLNRDYVAEVPAAWRPALARLTRAFAYVWYGDRPPSPARFARLHAAFDAFDAQVTEAAPAGDEDAAEDAAAMSASAEA